MRLADYVHFSGSSLWKTRLRTSLTVAGVAVGIGALFSMWSFGMGVERNVTESFNAMELFNSITVLPASGPRAGAGGRSGPIGQAQPAKDAALDAEAAARIARLPGVVAAFPDIRFPAKLRIDGQEDFRLVQALPAAITASPLVTLTAGRAFRSDDEPSLLVSETLLRQFKIRNPSAAVGRTVDLFTVAIDQAPASPLGWAAAIATGAVRMETSRFTIIGVTRFLQGPAPLRGDVYVPAGAGTRLGKLPFTSLWDLFRAGEGRPGYAALNVRLSAPRYVESVRTAIREMGLVTVVLADQFEEIRRSFYYLDMMLTAVGMIGVFVASLGIINTMVMSILERSMEIGVMKAVGASDRDVRRIFFFESSAIGFLGGLGGLALGWVVSRLINVVVNRILAWQDIAEHVELFAVSVALLAGALAFSIVVSLVAGVYPAARAARVDPVVALRR